MDSLKTCATIICICCVACSIVSLIIPTGRMKKTVSLVLGLFLICSAIIPIKGLVDSFNPDIEIENSLEIETKYNEEDYQKAVLKQTADNLVKVADNLLKNEGVTASNIKISLKVNEENSIYISRIIIYITKIDKENADKIKEIIFKNMSKEPEIIVYENQQNQVVTG